MTDTQAQEAASSIREALAALESHSGWISEEHSIWAEGEPFELLIGSTEDANDAAYIAACNPKAIRALLDERDALRAELARMREPLYEALVRLLGSDPDGAIANASEDELTGAANDANADPVIREQAASVLQARAAAREYEAAHGITKTGGGV